MTALIAYFIKYRLGPTWIILQTFMGVVGYSLIFGGGVFNFRAPNGMPYFLYMMVGMMGWQLFQSTLTISARSFLRLRSLISDIYFPLILVPIAGSAQALVRVLPAVHDRLRDLRSSTTGSPRAGSLRPARAEVPVLLGRRASSSAPRSPGGSASGPRR